MYDEDHRVGLHRCFCLIATNFSGWVRYRRLQEKTSTLEMATILTSDSLINTYQTTRCQNPKRRNINLCGREGFRGHKRNFSYCHKQISVYDIGVQVRLLFHHNSESESSSSYRGSPGSILE